MLPGPRASGGPARFGDGGASGPAGRSDGPPGRNDVGRNDGAGPLLVAGLLASPRRSNRSARAAAAAEASVASLVLPAGRHWIFSENVPSSCVPTCTVASLDMYAAPLRAAAR
eukprot:COSAG06_NODE_267_length_18822_cov_26.254607_9_plen_113_part_00